MGEAKRKWVKQNENEKHTASNRVLWVFKSVK